MSAGILVPSKICPMPRLLEICAGSAAVTLHFLREGGVPPVGWRGGKRGYATEILERCGLRAGSAWADQCCLVEPGPWGEAWAVLRDHRAELLTCLGSMGIAALDEWGDDHHRPLWERTRDAYVPLDPVERVAAWLLLQHASYAGRPILLRDSGNGRQTWVTHGYDPQLLRSLLDALEQLPPLIGLQVLRCLAQEVHPERGWDVVLIDPPYAGTSTSYGYELSHPDLVQLALGWASAGALVVVCEAAPVQELVAVGWHAERLGRSRGRGRTASALQEQWITCSAPPLGQMGLL